MAQMLDEVLARRHVAEDGQDPEIDSEEQDQHEAEPESRHGEADERDEAAGIVRKRVAPRRRDDARRDRNQDGEHQGVAAEDERDLQALAD